jgi:hypothetical protein
MKQPNEQKLQQHLRAKARLMVQVQARVIDSTHLRYNRHAHCKRLSRPMFVPGRRATGSERTTSDSDSTPPLTPEAPQGSIGSQGAISPLIRQQMCSKAAIDRAATAADSTVATTTRTRCPAGFNRVSRGDQPLDRTANEFK